MAESGQENRSAITLAERFDRYRVAVQQVVERGIEHPSYELKRAVTISKENLPDRLDFVKLIQGLANAHIAEERFIVIGADQKERKFYNVANVDEFDPAKLSQIIAKYLDPQPRLEAFNNIRADGGESYVLIVIGPDQPRPVVAITEGKSDKRVHFGVGNIWIKKDTSLQLATRADLDQMYETYIKRRVDEEAETRARRRFEHFREQFGSSLVMAPATVSVPSSDLIVGDKGRLTKFIEATISGGNVTNFKMFIEMARERLIEKWNPLESVGTLDIETWNTKRAEVYQDEFIPALDSTVDLGLQIIKYDASSEWFEIVVKQLREAFEACRKVDGQTANNIIAAKAGTPSFARPAYDVYVSMRTLATYAVMRERFRFLKEILLHYARFITPNGWSQVSVPLLFWPFSGVAGLPDMRQGGRNKSFWDARIHGAWGQFFGSEDKFLSAASQLEFVLEFNSYVFEGVKIPEVQKLWESLGNIYFAYLPDFWTRPLDPVLPMAERFYDILSQSDKFPPEFAIETRAMDSIFKIKGAQERLLFLGCFLAHLRSWQAKVMMEQNRFPFMFEWQGRLKVIVDMCQQAKAAKQAKG
jgi:hypothetical protein